MTLKPKDKQDIAYRHFENAVGILACTRTAHEVLMYSYVSLKFIRCRFKNNCPWVASKFDPLSPKAEKATLERELKGKVWDMVQEAAVTGAGGTCIGGENHHVSACECKRSCSCTRCLCLVLWASLSAAVPCPTVPQFTRVAISQPSRVVFFGGEGCSGEWGSKGVSCTSFVMLMQIWLQPKLSI